MRQAEIVKKRWYATWFGEDYLRLYPHRDQQEARRGVELVLKGLDVPECQKVLDLACGAGRHLRELRDHGMDAVGLDLSPTLVRQSRSVGLPVVRGDMRQLPFASQAFALVTSFFTSFGYFEEPSEDAAVLREVARVLRPGGGFALDFLNARHVRATLRNRDERITGGRRVVQVRTLADGGRAVEKRIEIYDPEDAAPRVYFERVRLYEQDDLMDLLSSCGLTVLRAFGDYSGVPLSASAPRVLLLGRSL